MKKSASSRKSTNLRAAVNHRLNMYALAASAAGVAALALSQSAEAKVVYTPAHVKLHFPERYAVDLNQDGTPDFYLYWHSHRGTSDIIASALSTRGNGVAVSRGRNQWALPIYKGAKIGAARRFSGHSWFPVMAGAYVLSVTNPKWYGPWAGTGHGLKNRYLGIKFTVNGRPHYGWARVTIQISKHIQEVLLTGYAYETTPGKHIIAGKTTGPDVITLPPGSLGHLARGIR